jgi:ATP-binding cassette, subfamily C, bacterial LapB
MSTLAQGSITAPSVTSASGAAAQAQALQDPLVVALALLAARLERVIHASALRSGFATDAQGRLDPADMPEVARRHGLAAAWTRTPPSQLPAYVLPCLVPCLDGRCFVLLGHEGPEGHRSARVLVPESGQLEQSLASTELDALCSGQVLVVKALPQTGEQVLTPMRGQAAQWFWGTLWRFKHFYTESLLASLLANVLTLSTVFFAMNVYDRVVPTQAYVSLWTLAVGTVAAIVIEFGMRWLKARLVDLGGQKADLAINAVLLREIMAIRLEHRPQSVGIFASSMRDFESLREFFSSSTFVLLTDLPFVLMFVGLIFVLGGPLGWIVTLAVLLTVLMALLVQRPLMRSLREHMKESGDRQSVLVESMLNLEVLKAYNAEGYLQRRWELSNAAGAQAHKKTRDLNNLVMGLSQSLQQLVSVTVIVGGVYQIHANAMSLGALIAVNILAGRAMAPLGKLMGLAARLQQARTALQTLDGLIQRPRDREDGRRYVHASAAPVSGKAALAFEALDYAYPGEQPLPVIRQLNLRLAQGQQMALLGRVGSGKSTLLRLGAGFYKPTAGQILVDGLELGQIEPASLRARLGWVGQQPMLFMGTLRENLVLADSWISDQRIVRVLQRLDLYGLVAHHPRGLDLPLTEAGGGLSGGQLQLLSMARMMLREPALVFLDEPTSAMDQTTEAVVISALRDWLPGRTVLLATHRPQLLELVDSMAVLDQGRCLSQGPRQAMLEQLTRGIERREQVQ